MRVLLPIFRDQVFPREQANALREHCEVDTSFEAFWANLGAFDIIQLNWPEELTQWREPTDLELTFLQRVLRQWAEKSKIVVVRHNFRPHYADTARYRKLYEIVYSAAHAIVHMGSFSVREYQSRYSGMKFLEGQIQEVIPHPVFSCYPDNADRAVARRELGISSDTYVLLAFGRVQSAPEKNLVVDTYLEIPHRNKIAIVPGWRPAPGKEPINRIKWVRLRSSGRFKYENRFVPDNEVGKLFRAADMALIPRVDVLNSGLVSLCIMFDCPMLAPDCGNLAEQAHSMGCELFTPGNESSVKAAVKKVTFSKRERPCYDELRQALQPAKIGEHYAQLYRRIIEVTGPRHCSVTC